MLLILWVVSEGWIVVVGCAGECGGACSDLDSVHSWSIISTVTWLWHSVKTPRGKEFLRLLRPRTHMTVIKPAASRHVPPFCSCIPSNPLQSGLSFILLDHHSSWTVATTSDLFSLFLLARNHELAIHHRRTPDKFDPGRLGEAADGRR